MCIGVPWQPGRERPGLAQHTWIGEGPGWWGEGLGQPQVNSLRIHAISGICKGPMGSAADLTDITGATPTRREVRVEKEAVHSSQAPSNRGRRFGHER